MDGYLLIDKPLGWTSFDVVNKVRSLAAREVGLRPRQLKVGHAGTLDPMAGGLLIVLVGRYTKRQGAFMKQDKVYLAEVTLGQTSATDDSEGKKTAISDKRPSNQELKETLMAFVGRQEQVPPRYSAVKIKGRPAYARARAGQDLELKARGVEVYSIDDIRYRYPKLAFTCRVSSGTYVRSLARDLGRRLGTGAYLSKLKRISIGDDRLDRAVSLARLEQDGVQAHLIALS